jgi:aminoglycoside phosphotransferase (APT) family kinase protein
VLIEEVRRDALDDLATVARVAPHVPIAELRDQLAAAPGALSAARVLVHNDFAAEHVLIDAHAPAVTGVIDWSDAAISEPAVDFAGLFHWGGDRFADDVLAVYRGPVDDALRPRARFMALCRGVMDIAFGDEFDKPEYIRAGLRALGLCHNRGDLELQ